MISLIIVFLLIQIMKTESNDCKSNDIIEELAVVVGGGEETVERIPIVDLKQSDTDAAKQVAVAARKHGFFYISNHSVPHELIAKLERLSHQFFALDESVKERFDMRYGGLAWRGYFPLGGELTSGIPDWKTGLYLGTELDESDERVRNKTPLHGRNLIPNDELVPEFRATIFEYMNVVTQLAHRLMGIVALSLGLPQQYFHDRYTSDPLILFRIFQYPSLPAPPAVKYGVGEHTDYGMLTILYQDSVGGLEVNSNGKWIDAPPIDGTFVVNLGDMLDRMTGGFYKSTPHRVRVNNSGRHRLSLPLFFDPSMSAKIEPIRTPSTDEARADRTTRWDKASVHEFEGTYGDYVLKKVGKVFPELMANVM